jgi:hypothetical protein
VNLGLLLSSKGVHMVLHNLDDEQLSAAVENCLTEEQLASLYLQTLWPDHDDAGMQCVLHSPKAKETQKWFPQTETQLLSQFLMKQSAVSDTRLSWCSFNWRTRSTGRVLELPGLFVDIDLAGSHHERPDLPTMDESQQAVDSMPLPVSLLLHTGGGLLAVWLFDKPFKAGDNRQRAEKLLKSWEAMLREVIGKHVDRAAKLTAVPRVPGTLNHKSGTKVTILKPELQTDSYTDGLEIMRGIPRHHVSAFEEHIVEVVDSSLDGGEPKAYSDQDKADAIGAVQQLTAEQADDRESWIKAGLCLKEIDASFDEDTDLFHVWCEFSRKSDRFPDTDDERLLQEWNSFNVTPGCKAVGTLVDATN